MPAIIPDIDELAEKALKTFDDNFESRQETELERTKRLEIDTTSPFKLPHLIRPIIAIWAMAVHTLLSIIAIAQGADALVVLGASGTIVVTVVGFYFNARKAEKINAKKMMTTIELEKDKGKVALEKEKLEVKKIEAQDKLEIKQNRKEARADRKEARKEARQS